MTVAYQKTLKERPNEGRKSKTDSEVTDSEVLPRMPRRNCNTRKTSRICLSHFLPHLQIPLEDEGEEGEEGDSNDQDDQGGQGGQDDQNDQDDQDNQDGQDDQDEDEEDDGSDEEDDDSDEDTNDGDGDNVTEEEKEQVEKFDFDKVMGNMPNINMEDEEEVEKRIERALQPHERRGMELSREIEEKIISALPTNAKVVDDMENDPDIKRCVETYRQHVRTLIKSLAQFMLAAASYERLPRCMRGWFLYIVANATKESRERLLNLLTHPSIQLLAMQYLLGQPVWWPSMFDSIKHRIDVKNAKERGDAVTAYIAIGHLSEAIHYLYNGSGTSLDPNSSLIGEAARMAGHDKVMVLTPEEMARRRRKRETSLDKSVLLVHTLLARSKEHFFLPSQRYPVDMRDPTDPIPQICAGLALYAENLNMILFSSRTARHMPRSALAMPFIHMSHLIIENFRPPGLPDCPWNGANMVLPMTQGPRAMWKLLKANIRVEISSALNDKLRQYFAEEGKVTLRRSVCFAMLDSENLPLAPPYIKAMRLFYADILAEHGLQYRTYHEDKNLRLIILWVAIIHEAESCSLVRPLEDDESMYDEDRYHLEDSALDWTNVAIKARQVASPDLRDDYSEGGCRKLYNAGESKFFNRNVLLRSNWNRLRLQVVHGAWEDTALEALINGELLRACKLLENGLSLAAANNWEKLEKLESEWARPRNNDDSVMTDAGARQAPRLWDPSSLPADHDDSDDNVQLLLDDHVQPNQIFQAKDRASRQRSEAKVATASITMDTDDDDIPFELWDQDCEPLKTRLFAIKNPLARQPSQGRPGPSKTKSKDAVTHVPSNTGTCSRCGAISNNLSEHEKNCRGRCQRCDPFVVCIPDPHGPACLSCKAEGYKACKYPNTPKKEQKVLCQQCKRYISQGTMRHHKNKCRGRCKPCREAGEACVPSRGPLGSTKCQRCKETPGDPTCAGFSHQHLLEPKVKEECKKCHGFYPDVKTHEDIDRVCHLQGRQRHMPA
ncbi:hypothetical protein N0V84_001641 [Fusarium piperis]|uniref:Uncharacterized protein n=1 Tax=Fusarium piperis TaxID=1435070 RepID=A0A9W9BTR7_9HYPO|nr:hypothetical protein N0V84_001641 [Fusarium piperis]